MQSEMTYFIFKPVKKQIYHLLKLIYYVSIKIYTYLEFIILILFVNEFYITLIFVW